MSNVDLKDEELVDDVETLGNSDTLGSRCIYASIMKIGRHLRWIRRKLYALVL